MSATPTYEELERRIITLEKELECYRSREATVQLNLHYLQAILENTNLAIFLKDADFKYILMNRQLGYLARVDHTDVEGKNDFDFFPEPVAQLFRSQDEEVLRRRTLVEFEETILLPDGVQTFMTSKFPLIDSQGEVYAVGGVCTDITARKKTEADLREAEEKFRSIFEHSPLGIFHLDKKGNITACNEKLADILGSSVEKLLGFNTFKYLDEKDIQEAFITVLSGEIAHYEGYYTSLTGGRRAYIHGVASPIYSNDGSITGAICIIEDITGRKQAEEELQKANDRLEQRVAERTAQLNLKTERLIETNVALKVLLEKRDEDKKELAEKVMFNVENLIKPYLDKLKMRCTDASQDAMLKIIQTNLDEITSSFAPNIKDFHTKLTPTQIQIADMIKQGQSTKEIAHILNLSPATIACHRQEIRKRLALTNKKINLQAALATHLNN